MFPFSGERDLHYQGVPMASSRIPLYSSKSVNKQTNTLCQFVYKFGWKYRTSIVPVFVLGTFVCVECRIICNLCQAERLFSLYLAPFVSEARPAYVEPESVRRFFWSLRQIADFSHLGNMSWGHKMQRWNIIWSCERFLFWGREERRGSIDLLSPLDPWFQYPLGIDRIWL